MKSETFDIPQAALFVVLNPVSGSCDPQRVRDTLTRACREAGIGCDFYETTGQEDLPEVVRHARQRGYPIIVAAGGDGTVSAVAGELIDSEILLGVLAVGTANLLARELRIPLDLEAACRLLVRGGHVAEIDAMRIDKRVFLSHVSVGVYSHIAERTSPTAKRYFRQLAYVWHALPALLGHRTWRFFMEVDGKVYRLKASTIMLANVGAVGAATLRWGPDIRPDDGVIDICIIKARTLKHYLSVIWHALLGRHKESTRVRYFKVHKRLRLRTAPDLPVRGDGEIVTHGGMDMEILPRAVKIIVTDEAPI